MQVLSSDYMPAADVSMNMLSSKASAFFLFLCFFSFISSLSEIGVDIMVK